MRVALPSFSSDILGHAHDVALEYAPRGGKTGVL
jgi:hypothetical protein